MACDGCYVQRGLHASLDFERGDACVLEPFEAVVEPQVAHGEGERLSAGGVRVRQTAAVGAFAAVPAAVLLHGREKAESGNGVAECAMHEHFRLDPGTFGYGADFLQRQFPCEHYTSEAEFLHGEHALKVVGDELRGSVQGERGEM